MEVAVSSIVKQVILSSRAAAMTLRTVLLSLQALLAAAEPDDPQDAVVAKQYKENNEIFKKTARHWTYAYAGGHLNYLFILYVLVSLLHSCSYSLIKICLSGLC